ncbi:MAG: protein phosphatase CheZ [Leptospirillia bacterium]
MTACNTTKVTDRQGGLRQLIGFQMGSDAFAVDISRVHEIIKPLPVKSVPESPSGFSGVIQLRDEVVVMADLHTRFGFPAPDSSEKEVRIIVLEGVSHRIAILVDAVSEVVRLPESAIDPPPKFHNGIAVEFISGMGKLNGELLTILDVDALFPEPAEQTVDEPQAEAVPEAIEGEAAAEELLGPLGISSEDVMKELGEQAAIGSELYQDLGELTRYINQARQHLAEKIVEESSIKVKAADIPTAHELLDSVTRETENATMQVMNNVDETSTALGELRGMLSEMEDAVPSSIDSKAKVSDMADRMRSELENVNDIQQETMMALSFQDLTGQKIKQVTNLMKEVEERLLHLVVKYGVATAHEAEEAVQEKMQKIKSEEGIRQDKVDDMLAEFGF